MLSMSDLKKLKTDKAKWAAIIASPNKNFVVILDNDVTHLKDKNSEDYLTFSESIGNSSGLLDLLAAMNIYSEYC